MKLILPVLFAPIPDERSDDPVVQIARSLQWRDWTRLRLLDPTSSEVLAEISSMARQLIDRAASLPTSERSTEIDRTKPLQESPNENGESTKDSKGEKFEDDDLGITDKIALAEEVLPDLGEAIQRLGKHVQDVAAEFSDATPKLQAARSFRDRVSTLRRVAHAIGPVVDAFYDESQQLDRLATTADPGVDALLDFVEEAASNDNSVQEFEELLRSIITASDGMTTMSEAAEGSRPHLETAMSNSRDLRPHLRRYLEGVDYVVAAAGTVNGWGVRAARLLEAPSPSQN